MRNWFIKSFLGVQAHHVGRGLAASRHITENQPLIPLTAPRAAGLVAEGEKLSVTLQNLPPAARGRFLKKLPQNKEERSAFTQISHLNSCEIPPQKLLIITIILITIGSSLFGQLKTAKLISTFDEKDKHYIDTVYCREKYETTFILPPNRNIKKVVTGDPDEWEIVGKYGGRIVSVKPLLAAGQTSLTIVAQNLKVYKFNIVNIDAVEYPGFDVIAIVEIREKNTTMEVIKRDDSTGENLKHRDEENLSDRRQIEQKKEEMLIKLNYDYRWKDKYFDVENVYDDGIFTYIVMPGTREFPAVYISSGKKNKRKSLEPIKYVVKPGMIVIHRIIENKEKILLRLGSEKDKKESHVYRKKKRR